MGSFTITMVMWSLCDPFSLLFLRFGLFFDKDHLAQLAVSLYILRFYERLRSVHILYAIDFDSGDLLHLEPLIC